MDDQGSAAATKSTSLFVEVRAADRVAEFERTGSLDPERFQRLLKDRGDDIRYAIQEGTRIVAASLPAPDASSPWKVAEVSASFGISLGVDSGSAWIVHASAEATISVEVTLVERGA